jgi:glucose-6-phosphate-specific signal transduction histidine kinase
VASRTSIGLTGLTERVTLAGGTVEIFSRVGQGTRIQAEFPLGVAAEPKPSLPSGGTGGLG